MALSEYISQFVLLVLTCDRYAELGVCLNSEVTFDLCDARRDPDGADRQAGGPEPGRSERCLPVARRQSGGEVTGFFTVRWSHLLVWAPSSQTEGMTGERIKEIILSIE